MKYIIYIIIKILLVILSFPLVIMYLIHSQAKAIVRELSKIETKLTTYGTR